jgi:membrane protein YqaA with SNARE-associated domain
MVKKYFLLLTDNFISSLILPVHKGFAFQTMLRFQEYHNIFLILFYGVIGSCLGGIVNWFIGRTIFYVRNINCNNVPYTLVGCAVVSFSWIPGLDSITHVIAGYLKLNIYVFISMVFLSYFIQSLYLILTI